MCESARRAYGLISARKVMDTETKRRREGEGEKGRHIPLEKAATADRRANRPTKVKEAMLGRLFTLNNLHRSCVQGQARKVAEYNTGDGGSWRNKGKRVRKERPALAETANSGGCITY